MRDILFKAKRKYNGVWVQGYYYEMHGKSYILFGMMNGTPNMMEVFPKTLCQCTGMSDKNCIEIYEHDVVKFFGMVGKIVFEAGAFGIATRDTIDWETIDKNIDKSNSPHFTYNDNFVSLWEIFWNFDEEDCNEIEVIGNIFDNPELLEVEE